VELTLEQAAVLTGGTILCGEPGLVLRGFAGLREAAESDLSFFANERYLNDLKKTRAGAVLVPDVFPEGVVAGVALIRCANASAAFAEIVKRFVPPPRAFRPGIHPSAVVDASAVLDAARVSVGPGAVIESGARIGEGTVIGPGCVIGEDVVIGRDCRLAARVTIYGRCQLGDRVSVHSGAVIGADGFGYEFVGGRHQKIDQVGIVQIDSDVEIGANTTIDRARFGRTWIGEGTRIDNLVMIAHNCVIGRHVIIVAQAGIAGSTRVADYTVVAAQVGIAGHLDIGGPGVTFTAKAGVTANIRTPGAYMGTPAQLMKEYQHQLIMVRRLPAMAERLRGLEQKLGATESPSGD
jgi:UDP-3-O-[3-hydroxymyristoyl] glucosamine N-acyltransferase